MSSLASVYNLTNWPVKLSIFRSLSAITLAAALEGVHMSILSHSLSQSSNHVLTIAQVVIDFPVPGGPWTSSRGSVLDWNMTSCYEAEYYELLEGTSKSLIERIDAWGAKRFPKTIMSLIFLSCLSSSYVRNISKAYSCISRPRLIWKHLNWSVFFNYWSGFEKHGSSYLRFSNWGLE